jgi:hypothetical protein
VNRARRHAWAQAGPLPPVQVADRVLEGVTCIRLDATVVQAHSDKELAEPNFKGFGLLTELPVASSQFNGHAAGCWLRSLLMADDGIFLDMAGLAVLPRGELRETGNPWMPFELVDADGGVVAPVAAYLKDVQACGRSEATLRSYSV